MKFYFTSCKCSYEPDDDDDDDDDDDGDDHDDDDHDDENKWHLFVASLQLVN